MPAKTIKTKQLANKHSKLPNKPPREGTNNGTNDRAVNSTSNSVKHNNTKRISK